ncbi:polysaccharide lyase family 1 protein [Mucilaginibacter sp. L3T2-6]|uniref:pectate lyase family protein n=1 Tax=Mucilaginibacter sp. L3T2-6 TaxID=3062491 RepID=UPI002674FD15|nr:pectate lyase [Mucilaginibacter sp. L3T2-6]MDO3644412.1 pectate lyase [Mucilaginibacter sp. L3T2-6]MDV6216864.1 pectate lyase [Mucilaginibacter sp. L3T2-6]
MRQQQKISKPVAVVSMVLTAIILFGSCKKDAQNTPLPNNDAAMSVNTASYAATVTSYSVNLSNIKSDGGFAYKAYNITGTGDSNTQSSVSTLRLYEDGKELGPAHSVHQTIRDVGKGAFSHWGTSLIFSASDNTNPATNGRKYTYTIGDTSSTATSGGSTGTPSTGGGSTTPATSTGSASATKTGVSSALMGYAMVNGTTTGGLGGSVVTVSTLAELQSAVSGTAPKIIYVNGTIKGSGDDPVRVSSNKSIIGKPGATIEGISLYIFTVSNIIIQNITFKNYVTDAAVMIKYEAHHIWVDHCDFSTDRNHGWSYWGKDISITRVSDYVTVSWSKFHDTNLSVLISGGIAGHEADIGHLHVTMHHNFWYNVSEREPDMNYGSVHVFNNYHLNNTGYSLGARAGGNVRTDNNYFQGCAKPLSTNLAGNPPGYFSGVSTNIFQNCGSNDITTAITNWMPSYSFSSVLDPAASVPSIVQKSSGAILTN